MCRHWSGRLEVLLGSGEVDQRTTRGLRGRWRSPRCQTLEQCSVTMLVERCRGTEGELGEERSRFVYNQQTSRPLPPRLPSSRPQHQIFLCTTYNNNNILCITKGWRLFQNISNGIMIPSTCYPSQNRGRTTDGEMNSFWKFPGHVYFDISCWA